MTNICVSFSLILLHMHSLVNLSVFPGLCGKAPLYKMQKNKHFCFLFCFTLILYCDTGMQEEEVLECMPPLLCNQPPVTLIKAAELHRLCFCN